MCEIMLLIDFKIFYCNHLPKAISKAPNEKTITQKFFLMHIMGDSKSIVDDCSLSIISKLMNGTPIRKVTKAFSKDVISDIENTINTDFELYRDNYLEIALDAKSILKNNLKNETNLKSEDKIKYELLCQLFQNPKNATSVAVGIKWWFIFSTLQVHSKTFINIYDKELNDNIQQNNLQNNATAINNIENFLKDNKIIVSENNGRKCAEISYEFFHELRRLIIDSAKGKIYISGETLGNAFSSTDRGNAPIIKNLLDAVQSQRIDEINVFIMDPTVFNTQKQTEPIDTLGASIRALIDQLKRSLPHNHCKLQIFFLPFLDIDHAVITDSFLLFRSTKLWTSAKNHKGSIMLYYKYQMSNSNNESIEDKERYDPGEYNAHKRYLNTIMENSVPIDTSHVHQIEHDTSRALHIHYDIRNTIHHLNNMHNYSIELYKLYSSQLNQLAISSFLIDKSRFIFDFNEDINNSNDLFNPKKLIGDNTQKILLPYIKETEKIFNKVIKRYDKRNESGAIVIPSLDLGYPNNIMRLAGGFATGMFIDWECGTPIIPVDATVNVCSSSVFEINEPSEQFFQNFKKNIKDIFVDASSNFGYSFSFDSGNHFLMIASDETGKHYLVLHSSAKEMKESYFGLYPKEENWYFSKIKTYKEGTRYLRYLKDEEAKYFIQTAHHLEKYNEEMHKWIANKLNWRKDDNNPPIIKHHYYMPTDSSIAIGTFVESPGETVPLFSDVQKPVYLFKIGEDNWTYNLGEKKVCIVPHGWGQEIESIAEIIHNENNLQFKLDDQQSVSYEKVSTARIDERINISTNINKNKRIRKFADANDFLSKGHKFLKGTVVKTLTPEYLYCKKHIGKCEANEK